MVACPRCGVHLVDAERCPECGVALVRADDPSRYVCVAVLLDPFEGRHLAELLESRRIPVRLRRRGAAGWLLHLHGPRWGELMVPAADVAEAGRLVAARRAELAAGAALARARSGLAAAGRCLADVEPARVALHAFTGGGPRVVSPFGRFGWIEVAGGRLGPGGHLEGRLSTGSRLVRTVELCLALEAGGGDDDTDEPPVASRMLPLPEAGTVAFTLAIPGAGDGAAGYRLDARILGRRHVLATGVLHLKARPPLWSTPVTGRA